MAPSDEKPDRREPGDNSSTGSRVIAKPSVEAASGTQPCFSDSSKQRRGLAADFYDAPDPSPLGFSESVLAEMERKQTASTDHTPSRIEKKTRPRPSSPETLETMPMASSQEGSLLIEKPRATIQPPNTEAVIDPERNERESSSSSDEGYQSGLEPSILPLLLRKKLEGKKRSNAKPAIPKSFGPLEGSPELEPILKAVPDLMEVVSRERSEGITKVRSPGSYFPAADTLKLIPGSQESASRSSTTPPRKPSVYTPLMTSPLRTSTSRPASPIRTRSATELAKEQLQSMTSPTGLVFSNPFPKPPFDLAIRSIQPDGIHFHTTPTSSRYSGTALTPAIDEILEEPEPSKPRFVVEDNAGKSDKSDDIDVTEATAVALKDEALTRVVDDVAEDSNSDDESIRSTEVLTAEDIRDGFLSDHRDDKILNRGQEALTKAEKDLAAPAPEVLIPGPRRVIQSQDVRDRYVSYADFPQTYFGAVPRIEVTPGAIQNTQGEVVPIDDEDIHLAAGETLIDGTGRVWNSKGIIEPGRDEHGEAILYEVDIAQICQANNGELPAMMPWDDAQLFQDGWRAEGPRIPSYQPSDDTASEVQFSDMSFDSPSGSPYGLDRRVSDIDYLDRIDDQLDAVGDDALDDIEMAEAAEEQEAADEIEELKTHRKTEEKKGM